MKDKNKKVVKTQLNINFETTPILYTDNVNITVDQDGVVLDVIQRLGSTNQVKIVSRVGMAKSYANKFIKSFGETLLKSEGVDISGKKKIIN